MNSGSPLKHLKSNSKAQPSMSYSGDKVDEERTSTNEELKITLMSQSDGKSTHHMPPTLVEYTAPPNQPDLVGHSIACTSHSYPEPYYGEVVPAYGLQPMVHSHYMGVHSSRMLLPLAMAEEPVYVNAKQYHGILRRRQSRAKAELERKLIKVRKPYLHESRHLHAMRRARGSGGRFLNTKKPDTSGASDTRPSNSIDFGATLSDHASNTSSTRPSLSHFSNKANSSTAHQEKTEPSAHKISLQQAFSCGNTKQFTSHHHGFQLSPYP